MFKVADPNSILLVELNTKGKTRTVAFRPDEERALMVGSDVRADFRVSGTGVAAVAAIAFHLERRDGIAWLVPAYELRDLRVNTARVTGPLPLKEWNVIEFGEVRIDIAVLDGGLGGADENPASGDDVWSQRASRTSEPPGEDDTTLIAMRAIAHPTNQVSQQTTAMLRPIHTAALAPQQTERMAPYRPPSPPTADPPPMPGVQITERLLPLRSTASALGPAVTAFGTEIMAPYRPSPSEDVDAPPPTVRTGKQAAATAAPTPHSAPRARAPEPANLKRTTGLPGTPSSFGGSAVPPPLVTSPIVPVPVVAVTLGALAKGDGSSRGSNQTGDGDTTLFEMPVVRPEHCVLDGQSPNNASTTADGHTSTPPEWSNDKTHRAVAKTPAPAARMHSWLEKLGLLAKARPALVAGGVVVGALVLATALLGATRLMKHHEALPQQTAKVSTANALTPQRAAVAAAHGLPEPIQIVESSPTPTTSASRATPLTTAKKTPSDPELAAAVADVIAGRYSEARAAYAALMPRTDNAMTYSTLTRLLARVEHAECAGDGPGAPKDCPGVHR